jgi:menaquinone-9 beta-reductase
MARVYPGAVTLKTDWDVVVVGGGFAGSLLGGVLARAGLDVLVAEKEPQFRDRVRGEAIHPWGVTEAKALGILELFELAGGVSLIGIDNYHEGVRTPLCRWAETSIDGALEIAFAHPRMQEIAFGWAQTQGATAVRPMKVTAHSHNGFSTLVANHEGRERELRARLVVGADGKLSQTRQWTGGTSEADPEHHRFGGVAVSGVDIAERDRATLVDGADGDQAVVWFPRDEDTARLYLMMSRELLHRYGVERSFEAITEYAAHFLPEGALTHARQVGPIGYFANSVTWATRAMGNGVVLIGDAAGSLDPTQGHGTALALHDIRQLSDLLLGDDDWDAASAEYVRRRAVYFKVLHSYDQWQTMVGWGSGPDVERLREGKKRAQALDPSLGGFNTLETRGPHGLVADAAARAMFFGAETH